MKKNIIVIILAAVISAVYLLFFTTEEKKARRVRQNIVNVKPGMSPGEVKKFLSEPDTIYQYKTKSGDDVTVFQYYQGFGAPDVLRVVIRRDSVIDLISDN